MGLGVVVVTVGVEDGLVGGAVVWVGLGVVAVGVEVGPSVVVFVEELQLEIISMMQTSPATIPIDSAFFTLSSFSITRLYIKAFA